MEYKVFRCEYDTVYHNAYIAFKADDNTTVGINIYRTNDSISTTIIDPKGFEFLNSQFPIEVYDSSFKKYRKMIVKYLLESAVFIANNFAVQDRGIIFVPYDKVEDIMKCLTTVKKSYRSYYYNLK